MLALLISNLMRRIDRGEIARKLARAEKIPVVAITETEPAGKTYQAWMLAQLEALDKALAGVTQ